MVVVSGGESDEYTETGGEGAYRKKIERRRATCLFGGSIPVNLGGGERKGPHQKRWET